MASVSSCCASGAGNRPVSSVWNVLPGGSAWAPMTYSPKTNLVYIPANIIPTVFGAKEQEWDGTQLGGGVTDTVHKPKGLLRSGTLRAMDPTTNKIVWQQRTKFPMGGGSGLLGTAGGLLFHGESDGNLAAYDINNGEELWKFQTGAGANAPVATYTVNGEQYVAAMAGGNSLLMSQRGDRLWSFKLGGTVPPAEAPREPPTAQPSDFHPGGRQGRWLDSVVEVDSKARLTLT